jgi:hypothetical protein
MLSANAAPWSTAAVHRPRRCLATLIAAAALLAACSDATAPPAGPDVEAREPCADRDPRRRAYFGDLHVHTRNSFDAWAFGVRATPEDAYRFARGGEVLLPPNDAAGNPTRSVRLERPLDFAAVTDHSVFLAEIEACTTPGTADYESATCVDYRSSQARAAIVFATQMILPNPRRNEPLCGADGSLCTSRIAPVWQRMIDAAEAAYDRSEACSFTSFVAYEYTATTGVSTQHRNVIFSSARVPVPISYFEEPTRQGLWRALREQCIDAGIGCDAIAIPHNTNESNGNSMRVEYPGATSLDDERAQAEARAIAEPLIEIYQHKGDSECRNGLSGTIGSPDELCAFEKIRPQEAPDCGDVPGSGGSTHMGCISRLDFVRGILLEGLKEETRLGVNPYRLGIIASTDTHNATSGNVDERTFAGHQGTNDESPQKRLGGAGAFLDVSAVVQGPGGLAAVWAEENSRPALFAALKRRETFGTSGPRIAVRFFGGFDLPAGLCEEPDLVRVADERGVAMGGVLLASDGGGAAPGAPRFVIHALRDPGTATRPGALLERLQIVKGWVDAQGAAHERVFDAAGEANAPDDVDLDTCTPRGRGADSLCATWSDPEFDPSQAAFYYARVLEVPTCRWTQWACVDLPAAERPPACSDPALPRTIRERAWTSPIWWDGA